MRRGVKPELMSLRSFVCSGGSWLIIRSDGAGLVAEVGRSGRNGLGAFWNPFQSRETRCTSACRVTAQ